VLFRHGRGHRKTSVDTEALRPIRRQENDLREEHAELALHYRNDLAGREKARDVAIKKAGGDRAAIRAALDEIGVKPMPPFPPVLVVEEPTSEGQCKLLAASRPSLGIFSNEGGQLTASPAANALFDRGYGKPTQSIDIIMPGK
jgi:hypothetical protein